MPNLIQKWFGFGANGADKRMSANTVNYIPDLEASFLRSLGIDPIHVSVTGASAMSISTFYACIRFISDLTAAQPYSVYRSLDSGGSEVAKNHRLHYLLHTRPNAKMSPFIFKRTMIANMLVYGYAVARILRDGNGNPVALIPYKSTLVEIVEEEDLGQYFFKVRTRTGKLDVVLSEDEVIFFKDLGLSGECGHSVVDWQKNTLKLSLLASKFADNYYEKGAFLQGVLTTEIDPSNKEIAKIYRDRIKESLRDDTGIAVLGRGVDYKPVARGPVESQVIEFLERSDKDIAKFFGIPLAMLGDTEKQTSWGTGLEQNFIGITNTVIIPKAIQLEQEIDYKCLTDKESRSGYYTKFNFRNLLRGDAKSYAEFVRTMIQNGVYSINEVRKWDELPSVEGGDVHWIQQNMMPIDKADEILTSKNNGKRVEVPASFESDN